MLSASEDWKQSHSAGLRAPSTSIPRGSQQSPKEGCLGPTLVPIPFPPTLQLSARPPLPPPVLCMLRRSQRSKTKHSKAWSPARMWRELFGMAVRFTIVYLLHFMAGTERLGFDSELSLCDIWSGSNFL